MKLLSEWVTGSVTLLFGLWTGQWIGLVFQPVDRLVSNWQISESDNWWVVGFLGRSASGLGIWRVSGWVVPSVVVSKWSIVWSVDLSVINPDS